MLESPLPIALVLDNEQQTQLIGSRLAAVINLPLSLSLRGDLGAGKSTLVRALLRGLGVTGAIKSPTFSLVESYPLAANQWAHHFDLYRIDDASELDLIGFRDFFSLNTLCCIEWPERAGQRLARVDIDFLLCQHGPGRLLEMSAFTPSGQAVLAQLAKPH